MLHVMYMNISKMADQRWPVNPRMHYVVITVTSSKYVKLSQAMSIKRGVALQIVDNFASK